MSEEEKQIMNQYEVRFTTQGEDTILIDATSEKEAENIFINEHAAEDDEITKVVWRKTYPPEPPYVDPNQILMDV